MKPRGALCARYQLFKPLDYPAVFGTRAVLRSNHANKDSTLPMQLCSNLSSSTTGPQKLQTFKDGTELIYKTKTKMFKVPPFII